MYYHKSTKIRKMLKAENDKINYQNEIFRKSYFAAWQHRNWLVNNCRSLSNGASISHTSPWSQPFPE